MKSEALAVLWLGFYDFGRFWEILVFGCFLDRQNVEEKATQPGHGGAHLYDFSRFSTRRSQNAKKSTWNRHGGVWNRHRGPQQAPKGVPF